MSPLDSSDSDEDVIGTQSPPPVAAAPDARVLEQNQDDSPLINPENRHGITSRDGCEGVRSGPLSDQSFIDLVLDGLKYLVESSEEPVSVMPWNMLANFVNKTNLLANPISTGQIKDRVRTIALQSSNVLFQIVYTTSVVVRMVGIDGRALARDYSLRPVLG